MDEDAIWYGSRPPRRPHCIRRVPSAPRKGTQHPPPILGPCLLWPRLPISAIAVLLSFFWRHLRDREMSSPRVGVSASCPVTIVMADLCNRGPLYFCPVVSFFLYIFFFYSSPNLSGHRLDVYHTSTGNQSTRHTVNSSHRKMIFLDLKMSKRNYKPNTGPNSNPNANPNTKQSLILI